MANRMLWQEAAEDLYLALGVSPDATDDQIRHAWHERAKTTHPDVGGDPDRFQAANIAYLVLSDHTERAAYDQHRQSLPPESPAPAATTTETAETAETEETLLEHWPWGLIGLALFAIAISYIWPPTSIIAGTVLLGVVVTRYVLRWRVRLPLL